MAILDWQRMLFGDEPPLYLLEIVVRTLIVYLYALLLLRWLGSRTVGQLSTIEFLLVIALGSAVGDAMFYPDVPLLHALLVVTVVICANKLLDILIARSRTAERAIDGIAEEAVRDGVFCETFLKSTSMGPSEIFQELRERGIEHLGQVANAYIEADGAITVFRARQPRPGLRIVPPWEIEKPILLAGDMSNEKGGELSCVHCGTTTGAGAHIAPGTCPHCGHSNWTPAATELRYAEMTDQ
jgi:uncharacterized membrane protein YcaP (DUF421 family)